MMGRHKANEIKICMNKLGVEEKEELKDFGISHFIMGIHGVDRGVVSKPGVLEAEMLSTEEHGTAVGVIVVKLVRSLLFDFRGTDKEMYIGLN